MTHSRFTPPQCSNSLRASLILEVYRVDANYLEENPLNAELNPICHLLALLGAHPILHVSRIRVNFYILVITSVCYIVIRNSQVESKKFAL